MQEFTSISVSSYEADTLPALLNEKSGDGWSVVSIVPTGSTVTAYLSKESADDATQPGADASKAPEAAAAATAIGAVAGKDEPKPGDPAEPTAKEPGAAGVDADAGAHEPEGPRDAATTDAEGKHEADRDEPGKDEEGKDEEGKDEEGKDEADTVAGVDAAKSPVDEPAGYAVGTAAAGAGGAAATTPGAAGAGAAGAGSTPAATTTASTPASSTPASSASTAAAAAAAPAGWYADPSSRYELRYWDGSSWTEHVSRAGQQFTDPPVA